MSETRSSAEDRPGVEVVAQADRSAQLERIVQGAVVQRVDRAGALVFAEACETGCEDRTSASKRSPDGGLSSWRGASDYSCRVARNRGLAHFW